MSWFTDFFKYEIKRGFEDPKERQKAFEDRLDAALVKQDAERKYADMSSKPKYRFQHLQMDPYYEQRNKMFPHRKYVRREGASS